METDERPRRIAGRYVVDRLIARGGMAAVYLAEHADLRRRVALKILRPPEEDDNPLDFEQRFRLEAQTLAALDHPNIVTLHDFGELDDGRVFLAMEFVDGPRLTDLVREGPLPADQAIRLMLQVCSALRYAHRRGVIHRDLKPSNLLIRHTEDGDQVKVVDFGLVKLTDAEQSMTRAGLVLGSPHCMAPEQVQGGAVTPATDVYAIGVLLFRTVMGQYPFHGSNSAATMLAHINNPSPTFFATAPDIVVPSGLEEIVRNCLRKDPSSRYQSMDDLIADLAGVVDLPSGSWRTNSFVTGMIDSQARQLPPPVPQPVVEEEEPPPRSMVPFMLMAVVIGVVGIALGISAVMQSGPPEVQPVPSKLVAPVATAEPVEPEPVEDEPTPEPTVDPVPVETPTPAPVKKTPVPAKPTPRKRPKPTPKRAAPVAVDPPPPTPKPTAKPKTKPKTPDGYKGLPEDW